MRKINLILLVGLFITLTSFTAATIISEGNADINRDGIINLDDYTVLKDNFGSTCSGDNSWCNLADINEDGLVDLQDFGILKDNIDLSNSNLADGSDSNSATLPENGDANGDGLVNLQDYEILKNNFGLDKNATLEQGDFNGDGLVDIQDFGILKDNINLSAINSTNSLEVPAEPLSNLMVSVIYCNPADINADGSVDSSSDYEILKENFGREDCSIDNSWCNFSDINQDGTVDLQDFGVLKDNMTTSSGECVRQ